MHGNDKELSKLDKKYHQKKLKVWKKVFEKVRRKSELRLEKSSSICLRAAELESTLKGVEVVKKLRGI